MCLSNGEREMPKKLYRVKVVLYVMAENESEARVAATNARFDIFECTARKAERIDPGWDNAIPYNAEDESTCAEVFARQQTGYLSNPFLVSTEWRPQMRTRAPVSYANP
jgi:hypothetical protein